MKLSTKVRYGLRALIELALYQNGKPVFVQSIADKQAISKKYLENLLSSLKGAGIVRSVRGAKGGYVLARPPEEIKISEVYEALEGPLAMADCISGEYDCPFDDKCPTQELWLELTDAMTTLLRKKSLADMAKRAIEKQDETTRMYYI